MTIPVIKDSSKAVSSAAGVTLTCLKPTADINEDDFLILICGNDYDSTANQFSDSNKPSGWTFLGQEGNRTSDAHIGVYYKVASGSEGTVTVTTPRSEDWFMFYGIITGVDTATPINTSSFSFHGDTASHDIPSVTTTEDDCLILYGLSFNGADGYTYSVAGTGYSQEDQAQASGGSSGSSGCFGSRDLATAGASGIATVTCSVSDGAAFFQLAINAGAATPTLLPIMMNMNQFNGGIYETD